MQALIAVEEEGWPEEAVLAEWAEAAIAAALEEAAPLLPESSEVSILFTGDDQIRSLNARWRGKDRPTNVLSFPAARPAGHAGLPPVLGDIVLARQTIEREAALEGKPFQHHLMHLIVHGFLHLLGHDHAGEEEAEAMEGLERRILERLAIADPYR
jgi:probable rRNA maturation factor